MKYLTFWTMYGFFDILRSRIGGDVCHCRTVTNVFLRVHVAKSLRCCAVLSALWMSLPRHSISLTTQFAHTLLRSSVTGSYDNAVSAVVAESQPNCAKLGRHAQRSSPNPTVKC